MANEITNGNLESKIKSKTHGIEFQVLSFFFSLVFCIWNSLQRSSRRSYKDLRLEMRPPKKRRLKLSFAIPLGKSTQLWKA